MLQPVIVKEMLGELQQAGYRLTSPRRAVARVLAEAEDWLRPEDIHARARRYHPPLGLVTVYRALALFAELALVTRVHLAERCHGYAGGSERMGTTWSAATASRWWSSPGRRIFLLLSGRFPAERASWSKITCLSYWECARPASRGELSFSSLVEKHFQYHPQ